MNYEDIFRGLGFDPFNPGCNDLPGGFQDIDPQLYLVLGELLGNVIAGNLPINVSNSIGNWIELLGQVILTYSAQQQYFQNGPGRFYSPIYKNVGNPFCQSRSSTGSESPSNTVDNIAQDGKIKRKGKVEESELYFTNYYSNANANRGRTTSSSKNEKSSRNNYSDDIVDLKQQIIMLNNEINSLKLEISKLK